MLLARTLLAGVQESMEAAEAKQEEVVEESIELKYDFSEEATTESYWISEAIESAFEDIIHIDKVYHVADIKGEMQAFTENSTPEEIGVMLEGIITGGVTRVIDTLEKLISKLDAWLKKVVDMVKSIFTTGEKFVKNSRKIIEDKASNAAKYGKYQYSSFKYDFEAGNGIVSNIVARVATAAKDSTPTADDKKEASQMPDDAEQAEAQAKVDGAAKDAESQMESAQPPMSEWDQLMASIMEGLEEDEEETATTENAEEATTESTEVEATEEHVETDSTEGEEAEATTEAVDEEALNKEFEETLESIMEDLIEAEDPITMESTEVILEAANTGDIVSNICKQISKGKASSQGELVAYLRRAYRSNKEKKEIFTFFENASAQEMMDFVGNGKKAIETLKNDRKTIISNASNTVKELNAKASEHLKNKDEGAYNVVSRQATTLTAIIGLIQAALNVKIETYKEAVGEYTRILKGLVLYKGEKYVDESVDVTTEASKEEDMPAEDPAATDGEDPAMTDVDTKAIAQAAKDSENKPDKPATEAGCGGGGCKKPTEEGCKKSTEACATEAGCGGGKKKCATEEACGDGGCKKPTEEACGGKKSTESCGDSSCDGGEKPTEEACATESTEAEEETPATESVEEEDQLLTLFESAMQYL